MRDEMRRDETRQDKTRQDKIRFIESSMTNNKHLPIGRVYDFGFKYMQCKNSHTEMERSSGRRPWSSLRTMKLAFSVSSDDRDTRRGNHCVSVYD